MRNEDGLEGVYVGLFCASYFSPWSLVEFAADCAKVSKRHYSNLRACQSAIVSKKKGN